MGRLWVTVLFASSLSAQTLPLGQIIDEITCAADASQKYSLYLPSTYSNQRTWPLILAFDPGGRGRKAVEQYQAAAEKFGYVIAASNVSRNGSWAVSMGAAQAMAADSTQRFAIDRRRVYTAGMSGGARVALGIALASPDQIAGVVASSAGYPDSQPRKTLPFVLFGTAGTEDFNWIEMRELDRVLTSPHRLHIFPGGHVWLPSEVAVEAVEWLDLQAMKTGRLPRDPARLDRLFAARQAAAQDAASLEALAQDFTGLRDTAELATRAAALRKTKEAKEAAKREQAEYALERRTLDEILTWEQQLNLPDQRADAFAHLSDSWQRLAAQASAEADSPTRRIARRVTRGLAMGGAERTKDAAYLKLLAAHRPARARP